jgi:hypothetical protein
MKRVLKPNGRFVAATVGNTHMKEMMDKLQQAHKSQTWESFGNMFTLENGLEQLKPFFPNVTLSRYEDSLNVTEIEPIMAYIRSSIRAAEISEDELVKVQTDLEKELHDKGSFFITKAIGLFEAMK